MGKELELLQKMDLTAENRQKLEALITEAKKTGKVSSKHLVETLDDVDATQDQTERFYDILEQAGIEYHVASHSRTSPSVFSAGTRERSGTFGQSAADSWTYTIYVKREDLERARACLR